MAVLKIIGSRVFVGNRIHSGFYVSFSVLASLSAELLKNMSVQASPLAWYINLWG